MAKTVAKMKKKRLEIEYTFDFELIGIISSAKGYKLAWEVNHILGTRLARQPDLTIVLNKDTFASYVYYAFENEVNVLKLFRNKPNETELIKNLLVPEFPHYDYILLAQGEAHMASKRLQELLKNIPSIELTAFIPLTALKSKDSFIF
ncbi:MAG: IPExxxVDY family protein [Cyclobacteriaceae bacterium]|nr:IPExxxVDY family protein [Cyclobacteriaceae bacterium]